ncbi:MAG: TIGR03118 family protein [Bacteroidetes bacterium]|nr:TIGR03118 family protein [Bacteroidota bacterium]
MSKKKLAVGLKTGKKLFAIASVVALTLGCHKSNVDQQDLKNFSQVNLVANKAIYNPTNLLNPIDPTLQNGFGIAWSPNGIAWVNSVLGHVSELYKSEGDIARKPVLIPSASDPSGGFPCGIVFSGDKNFQFSKGKAVFIFSSFDGAISAWNGGDTATRVLAPNGASYTGLAIGTSGAKTFIYGANFGLKRIDVWDTVFHRVAMSFTDERIPSDYSPYNIQAVGDYLFVMYAKLADSGPNKGHGVEGKGFGYVDIFSTDGNLVKRFASNGTLDIPWGVTMAPASFLEGTDMGGGGNDGGYGDKSVTGDNNKRGNNDPKEPVILVGNFGDGRINVFSSSDGKFLGQLKSHSRTIEIDGLWALTFAPESSGIDQHRLYFSAGPAAEADGIFGFLIKQ